MCNPNSKNFFVAITTILVVSSCVIFTHARGYHQFLPYSRRYRRLRQMTSPGGGNPVGRSFQVFPKGRSYRGSRNIRPQQQQQQQQPKQLLQQQKLRYQQQQQQRKQVRQLQQYQDQLQQQLHNSYNEDEQGQRNQQLQNTEGPQLSYQLTPVVAQPLQQQQQQQQLQQLPEERYLLHEPDFRDAGSDFRGRRPGGRHNGPDAVVHGGHGPGGHRPGGALLRDDDDVPFPQAPPLGDGAGPPDPNDFYNLDELTGPPPPPPPPPSQQRYRDYAPDRPNKPRIRNRGRQNRNPYYGEGDDAAAAVVGPRPRQLGYDFPPNDYIPSPGSSAEQQSGPDPEVGFAPPRGFRQEAFNYQRPNREYNRQISGFGTNKRRRKRKNSKKNKKKNNSAFRFEEISVADEYPTRKKERKALPAVPTSLSGHPPDVYKQVLVTESPSKEKRWIDTGFIHNQHGTFTDQVLTEFGPLSNWRSYTSQFTRLVDNNVDAEAPIPEDAAVEADDDGDFHPRPHFGGRPIEDDGDDGGDFFGFGGYHDRGGGPHRGHRHHQGQRNSQHYRQQQRLIQKYFSEEEEKREKSRRSNFGYGGSSSNNGGYGDPYDRMDAAGAPADGGGGDDDAMLYEQQRRQMLDFQRAHSAFDRPMQDYRQPVTGPPAAAVTVDDERVEEEPVAVVSVVDVGMSGEVVDDGGDYGYAAGRIYDGDVGGYEDYDDGGGGGGGGSGGGGDVGQLLVEGGIGAVFPRSEYFD